MLWFKAFHLVGMVAWFAGLFYMFRLFVYHVENKDKPDLIKIFTIMEYRLYRYITFPAMIFTVLMGICLLVIQKHWLHFGWIHVKIFLLFGLIGYTIYIDWVRKKFAKGEIYLTSRQCRIRNEYPTLFLIAIVLLAVLKPF